MRLVIDGRALVGRRTGIGVHTASVASRLRLTPAPLIASHAAIEDRSGLEGCDFLSSDVRPGVLWQQSVLPRILKERGDTLWSPHGTLPRSLPCPAVITIHDLTSMTMMRTHRLRTILSFNLFIRRSVQMAHKVACVSRITADEVMRRFSVPSSKIEIVPNGVDPFFSPSSGGETLPYGLREREYLLYAGTLEPRKGLRDLLAAWRSLDAPRMKLVLCGDAGWKMKRFREELASEPDVIVTGFVATEDLRRLYRHAALFLYPSLYEGFGLPPLEAMACGTPVIATTAGALPEVLGDAAVLVRPGEPAELASAIANLSGDRQLREQMTEKGIDHAARYRWDQSAAKMQELFVQASETG